MSFILTADDGAHRHYEASGEPVLGQDGKQQGGVVVFRDFTDRAQ